MTSIEDRLADALRARAESVVDDGLPRELPVPRGRGPRWAPAVVAVIVVITVVVAATALGTRTARPPEPAQRPTSTGQPATSERPKAYVGPLAPPVERVWPAAVHVIPATGPGGRVFKPDVFVTGRVVVGRGLTRNRLDGIWSYDVGRRVFTRIAPLRDGNVMNSPVVVGDGVVAWQAFDDGETQIWAAPLTGGAPRLVTSFPAVRSENRYEGIDLAIAEGMAVWSPPGGGVHRVPLTGGRPEQLPGSKGHHLLEWPYAGRPEPEMPIGRPGTRPMEQLLDLRTGKVTSRARHPSGRDAWLGCGVTWCYDMIESWRRDGTGLRKLPGQSSGAPGPSAGRFVLLHQRDGDGRRGSSVHDLATGRTGLLGTHPTRRGEKAFPTVHVQDALIWYKRGDKQVLVNLRGIR
ncbi:hypothetical protein [Nonomuraea candida]|uniref:hypothetical protein n=1 Tax=Nonomuraea candida TaxID=359159 RepID=UPI0005BC657A|nr:hypothetical protein [Nonomuraea candida]